VLSIMPRSVVLHASDLHLDTPFEGIGRPPARIAARLRDASLAAWDALVELAIAPDAAAVLLAGGLCGVQDEHGGGLLAVGADGRSKQVGSELSRATTEQLYLSVRIGLALDLAGRGIALPLVMDDVLVHFDPERTRAVADVLADCARRQQVLVFTSQPAVRDLLMQRGGAQRIVEL